MTVTAKICGINDPAAMEAALVGGASHVGFVFYPTSPRTLDPAGAAALGRLAAGRAQRVGLFVDPDDALVDAVLAAGPLELLQLHGKEPPERLLALKRRTGIPVMKALSVAVSADIDRAEAYLGAADWLMFDGKAPKSMVNAMPGGNAVSFDWTLLSGRSWPLPWMLAGGLNIDNVAEAVRLSGARVVDCSSGVEDAPGRKSPAKIAAFLAAVRAIGG